MRLMQKNALIARLKVKAKIVLAFAGKFYADTKNHLIVRFLAEFAIHKIPSAHAWSHLRGPVRHIINMREIGDKGYKTLNFHNTYSSKNCAWFWKIYTNF